MSWKTRVACVQVLVALQDVSVFPKELLVRVSDLAVAAGEDWGLGRHVVDPSGLRLRLLMGPDRRGAMAVRGTVATVARMRMAEGQ